MREKLNADFLSAQRQWERYSEETRLKHEQELSKLRQQVYILEAKVCRWIYCDDSYFHNLCMYFMHTNLAYLGI